MQLCPSFTQTVTSASLSGLDKRDNLT